MIKNLEGRSITRISGHDNRFAVLDTLHMGFEWIQGIARKKERGELGDGGETYRLVRTLVRAFEVEFFEEVRAASSSIIAAANAKGSEVHSCCSMG